MTWGSCQMSERSFGENTVMRVFQKPKARPVHCDEHANKADWKKGIQCDTPKLLMPPG